MRPTLILTINENLLIAGVVPAAFPGVAYSTTLTGRGGIEPYLWFLDSGSFPTGISGTTDSNGDYVISGTSSDLGPHTFTILLLDSEGRSTTRTFNLLVQPNPLTITGTAPNAEKDAPYSYTFDVAGGIPPYYPFLVIGGGSGPLPVGLTMTQDSNGDVVISGTPTVASLGQTFTIAVNDSQSPAAFASVTNTIAVGAAPLVVTGSFANTTPGNPLNGSPLTISGGIAPYGISGSPHSGTRPTGVTFSIVGSTLVASGNVAAGSYSWTERVTSADGQHFDVVSSIVSAYPTLSVSGAFGATNLGSPLAGSPLTISGGLAPYSLSGSPYSGTRPAGVTISISGSAVVATGNTTTAASYSWTERVLSSDGQHYDVACSVAVTNSDPYWANVVALLHFDGTNGGTSFPDETGRVWTPNTGVTTSTTEKKFGTASGLFNGSTGYLDAASSSDFAFGTGDFTIEFFMKFGGGGDVYVVDIGSNGIVLQLSSGPKIRAYTSGTGIGGTLYAGVLYTSTVWTHVALVRNGSSLSLYVDGVLGATQTTSQNFSTSVAPHVGRYGGGGADRYFGNIDELRITKGVARYTSGFTPPTAPFPNS